jgi:type II secretory pathway component GspD/PulD (secretin)
LVPARASRIRKGLRHDLSPTAYGGAGEIRTFAIANGDPAELAKALQQLLPKIRVAVVPNAKSIMVYADPKMLQLIETILRELDRADPPARVPRVAPRGGDSALDPIENLYEINPLKNTVADEVAEELTEIFGKERVRVVAENASNSLVIVKASPADLLVLRKLLENLMDVPPKPKR